MIIIDGLCPIITLPSNLLIKNNDGTWSIKGENGATQATVSDPSELIDRPSITSVTKDDTYAYVYFSDTLKVSSIRSELTVGSRESVEGPLILTYDKYSNYIRLVLAELNNSRYYYNSETDPIMIKFESDDSKTSYYLSVKQNYSIGSGGTYSGFTLWYWDNNKNRVDL